jgi:hypothetical protein
MQKQIDRTATEHTLLYTESGRKGDRRKVTLVREAWALHATLFQVLPAMFQESLRTNALPQATYELAVLDFPRSAQSILTERLAVVTLLAQASPSESQTQGAIQARSHNTILHTLPLQEATQRRAATKQFNNREVMIIGPLCYSRQQRPMHSSRYARNRGVSHPFSPASEMLTQHGQRKRAKQTEARH